MRRERRPDRRAEIIAAVSPLFNKQGFAGTSISDVLRATSLEKGGLYNHFESKEELAIAAFEHAWERVRAYFVGALSASEPGRAYLHRFVEAFVSYAERPLVEGGCPLANAAVDSDDSTPFLREHVTRAIRSLRSMLRDHAVLARERGEFVAECDPDVVADFMLATFEGAAVTGRAMRIRGSARRAMAGLAQWLRSLEPV